VERIETLERAISGLRLEWSDTYEKIVRMMGRINKRAALVAAAAETIREDAPGSTEPAGVPTDPFSEQVRAIRRHGRAG